MSFTYDNYNFETEGRWIEGCKIILFANGTPYKRVVRYSRMDGLYVVFKNIKIFASDFD